jgi:hypothetical protein
MRFTAKLNPLVQGEVEVYQNDEIFCHLSESDFETFRSNFALPIHWIGPK